MTLDLPDRVERGNEILERHLEGLALEMSADPGDEVGELIVTAHGTTEHFPLLIALVASAPPLKHHRVTAFRART
ncbi:hypothetical protein, partial [Staphylococcus aureus]